MATLMTMAQQYLQIAYRWGKLKKIPWNLCWTLEVAREVVTGKNEKQGPSVPIG
jgi:hypothetical protein